jgi:hypothetical protein
MRKLFFVAAVISVFLICSCNKYKVRHTIQYFISGKSIMNVSYTDATGELIFVNNVSFEWAYAFNVPEDKRFVKLTVSSIDGGAVGGRILVDGEEAAVSDSNIGSLTLITRIP